jgi:hypothetical protein
MYCRRVTTRAVPALVVNRLRRRKGDIDCRAVCTFIAEMALKDTVKKIHENQGAAGRVCAACAMRLRCKRIYEHTGAPRGMTV